jgi:hypothetical protein
MSKDNLNPSLEEINAAKHYPNGWVYRFSKEYSLTDYVPPEDIIGAWKVDSNGNIVGDFIKNPKFIPNNGEV